MMEPSTRELPGGRELCLGYSPAFRSVSDWRLSYRQERVRPDGSVLRRTNWDDTTRRNRRLYITVTETQSAEKAMARIEADLADADVEYRPGPERFGAQSLMFPAENPVVMLYPHANLKISIVSGGKEPVVVSPWADLIRQELEYAETALDEGLRFDREGSAHSGAKAVVITFRTKWTRGESAWYKFVTSSGTLTRGPKPNQILLSGMETGPATVTGWAMEAGRETFWGSIGVDR